MPAWHASGNSKKEVDFAQKVREVESDPMIPCDRKSCGGSTPGLGGFGELDGLGPSFSGTPRKEVVR